MFRVGTMVRDKWRVDSLIGVGGTAAVYAATHRNGKRVAIKVLRTELLGSSDLVTRFVREGYVANKVEHAGVVSVLDDDRAEDGAPFLVMELLEGHSLERHTRVQHALPYAQVVDIGDQLLDVLAAAHRKGIVHRDIKPANIFLMSDGSVKVLDFGIARMIEPLEASMTQTGTAIGTPSYMPPEQARGRWKQVDERTDVWAAGATLYALLGSCKPRRADTVQEELLLAMTEPVPPLTAVAPRVPPVLSHVIAQAMEFEMNRRYGTAEAMQKALRDVAPALGLELPGMAVSKRSGTAVMPSGNDVFAGRVSSIPGVSNPSGMSHAPSHIRDSSGRELQARQNARESDSSPSYNAPLTTGRPITGTAAGAGPSTMNTAAHAVAFRSSGSPWFALVGGVALLGLGVALMFFAGRKYFANPAPAVAVTASSVTVEAPLPPGTFALSPLAVPSMPLVTASTTATIRGVKPLPYVEVPRPGATGPSIYRQR
jgi:eukaryotic-like serine/threonine-protein kinase